METRKSSFAADQFWVKLMDRQTWQYLFWCLSFLALNQVTNLYLLGPFSNILLLPILHSIYNWIVSRVCLHTNILQSNRKAVLYGHVFVSISFLLARFYILNEIADITSNTLSLPIWIKYIYYLIGLGSFVYTSWFVYSEGILSLFGKEKILKNPMETPKLKNPLFTIFPLLYLCPPMAYNSLLGTVTAIFHILASWVHCATTELPDKAFLHTYKREPKQQESVSIPINTPLEESKKE